jgi:hypothetical protein
MKASHFYISLGLGVICLALTIALIAGTQGNNHLQSQLQGQQQQINGGNLSQQYLNSLVQDTASVYQQTHNEKLKALLARNGFSINEAPAAGSNATPSPSPEK